MQSLMILDWFRLETNRLETYLLGHLTKINREKSYRIKKKAYNREGHLVVLVNQHAAEKWKRVEGV